MIIFLYVMYFIIKNTKKRSVNLIMDIKKNIIVAGGLGGVGSGIAKVLQENNMRVIIPTRNFDNITTDIEEYFSEASEKVVYIEGDISDENDAVRIREKILTTYGKIDGMVASLFGWWQGEKLVNMKKSEWEYVISQILTSHFVVAKTFLPYIDEGGSYTFVAGLTSKNAVPNSGPVSVGNAAELMLRKVFSVEENRNIRINDINLGALITRKTPKHMQVEDAISAIEVGNIIYKIINSKTAEFYNQSFEFVNRDAYLNWIE